MKMDKYYLLVDIDGTLSDASYRAKKYLSKDNPDWDNFYLACGMDAPIKDVISFVSVLSQSYDIVLCSGRRESCRETTESWLKQNAPDLKYIAMLFRKDGDFRHDTEVKPELLWEYMKKNHKKEPFAIFEDRNSMVEKWRKLGFLCFQPANGDF
jgi:hypothetical protein